MDGESGLPPSLWPEMSTILVVKHRCQFCYAFFMDQKRIVLHSIRCNFRFSETFEAIGGGVKFACAVSEPTLLAEYSILFKL